MPDNIRKISKGSFFIPLVITRNTIYDNIGEFPRVRMLAAKTLGFFDQTFLLLDSFYPNIYFKKAAHWVIT